MILITKDIGTVQPLYIAPLHPLAQEISPFKKIIKELYNFTIRSTLNFIN